MTQTLTVTVPIPDTHVLVAKDEYDELINYSLRPSLGLKRIETQIENVI